MWFRWIAFLMFGFVLLLTQFQVSHVFAESMPPKGCWRPVLPGPGKPSFEIRNIRYSKDLNGNFIVSACLVVNGGDKLCQVAA